MFSKNSHPSCLGLYLPLIFAVRCHRHAKKAIFSARFGFRQGCATTRQPPVLSQLLWAFLPNAHFYGPPPPCTLPIAYFLSSTSLWHPLGQKDATPSIIWTDPLKRAAACPFHLFSSTSYLSWQPESAQFHQLSFVQDTTHPFIKSIGN